MHSRRSGWISIISFAVVFIFVCSVTLAIFQVAPSAAKPQSGSSVDAPKARLATLHVPSAAAKFHVAEEFGKLPLSFEPNLGQTDSRVKFLSRGDGYNLFLTSKEAILVLHKHEKRTDNAKLKSRAGTPDKIETQMLRVKLVGANSRAQIDGVARIAGKSNYFIGNDSKKWRTGIPLSLIHI